MRRMVSLLAIAVLVIGVVALPATATPPDIGGFEDSWTEPVAACDGFELEYAVGVRVKLKTFYDEDDAVDRFHERWHLDATLRRTDLAGPELREQYTTTWMYEPGDFLTPTGHGMQFNTVVPGHGPVFKVNGTFAADFSGWPPLYESTAWMVSPYTAGGEAFEVLCGYFG